MINTKKQRAGGLIILACLLLNFSTNDCKSIHENKNEQATEIMQDVSFEKGFALTPIDPQTVKNGGGFDKTYVDTLEFGNAAPHPIWQVAQWYSKYTLAHVTPQNGDEGSVIYANRGRKIALYPDHSLWLEVDASQEYENPRTKGQHWPHLLISQDFKGKGPNAGDVKQLQYSMQIKLEKCENKMAPGTFNPTLHTAHTPFFFIVKNTNKQSKDFGQKIWFGIPSYDYRDTALSNKDRIMWDVGTSTYMYDIPARTTWGNVNLHDKQWHTGKVDLLPHIKKALEGMREKNVFINTAINDLEITGMNFGWEVPGTFDAAVRVKNISLKAIK